MKIIMMNMGVNKLLLIISLNSVLFLGLGQVGAKNSVTFEGGVGGDVYKWQTSQSFGTTTAASWSFNFMAGYNFHERVNVNLEFENHTYITDPDSSDYRVDYLAAHRLGIGLRYAIIDNPKYQLSLGGTFGGFNFGYDISDSTTTASFRARGIYQTYGITNKFLFGSRGALGLFLKAGIVNNPMTINEIIINGESKEVYQGVPISDYRFISLGYYLKFGITYNIIGN